MNPKDIVYKMVVLGRRLTTHFILDIFWGSSFMFHVVLGFLFPCRARERENTQKSHPTVTGITDTNFLSNATGNGDRKCIWQKDSVCVTGTFLSSAGVFVARATSKNEQKRVSRGLPFLITI